MDVYGKVDIYNKAKKFKDLKYGEVFFFLDNSFKDSTDMKIYMRGGRDSSDNGAINLETGIMYSFDKDLLVESLSAHLNIKREGK